MINKLKNLSPESTRLLESFSGLAEFLGIKIYLVGGAVRDLMLGRKTFDLDIVVEDDAIKFAHRFCEKNKKKFKKHHVFGTATVYFENYHVDFVTARSETYVFSGALPRVLPASLREDLFRRDFTINAMAVSLNKPDYGTLIDFYGGEKDLKSGLIRTLHDKSFLDDPTRILRAVRFEQRFSFKLEKSTLSFLRQAAKARAFDLVNPHRLRDELLSILKESNPCRYVARLSKLKALSFIDKKLQINKKDALLFGRIDKAICFYEKTFKIHRKLEGYILYLTAILIKLSRNEVVAFMNRFGLKKGDRIRILSIYDNLGKAKKLNRKALPRKIYQFLNPLSFESVIFFYANYPQKGIRRHINFFLNNLSVMRLELKGHDLKQMGFAPLNLYGKLFERLLYAKMDKGLATVEEEIKEAKAIFKNLS
ncbi:MAG: CCA tRNA nucleotidyltransferase [Candidatus Omnitrophota bacterium]|jgi:tRNA nucleotidyltransferase (CCA-adding enzyme)